METHNLSNELSGYYTYRSFLNNPLPVNDFNKIKLEEAELFLILQDDGTIAGTMSFPPEPGTPEKLFIDIKGKVSNCLPSVSLEFIGKGRSNTEMADILLKFSCSLTHSWENGVGQRVSLTGGVRIDQDHGLGDKVDKADTTASFVAVKRDFTEPREIDKIAIISTALSMVASKSHRLKHAVWHTIRLRGVWYALNEEDATTIRNLGWGLDRPPFDENDQLNLTNGAGEDFLFMHRKMIKMIREEYDSQGVPYIESWKTLPQSDAQQFFYDEQDDPKHQEKKIYQLNVLESGNMIPPAYMIPSDNEEADLEDLKFLKFLKSQDYFNNVMMRLERIFKNKTFLASLSLGALGNLLEFEIHNQMHVRWSSISRDPKSGEPADRKLFDFDDKWDDPKYDSLGDFYSSHVNPLFWRLHGWIDDRIEEWFNAHEARHPREVERYEYQGVKWFKPGRWVQVSKLFYWPEHHPHLHNNNDKEEIDVMLKVLEILSRLFTPQIAAEARFIAQRDSGSMSFMHDIKPDK
jgi:hypothetical protein